MDGRFRLRAPEWALLAFFVYVVAITPFFPNRPHLRYQPLATLLCVFLLLLCCAWFDRSIWAYTFTRIRDWLPIILTLVAFREMEFFLPPHYNYGYELSWIQWDRLLLEQWRLRSVIESLNFVVPLYLELCYFFVYGVASFSIAVLWLRNRRCGITLFLTVYLAGTLCAYALFPYFPSLPPRYAFPDVAPPTFTTWPRQLNLFVLNSAAIHTGVFPSAHVSSVFSAAFAMFLAYPQQKRFGWGLLVYAISVAVATIYGRYHYAVDVLGGIAVSVVATLLCLPLLRYFPRTEPAIPVKPELTEA
jgi:membrane-associated phospholipid phosphatase